MNLKYYLRGLGIGIVVSTLIVGIAAGNRSETLSDEEIRQRAKELGMVETSGTLAEEAQVLPKENASADQADEAMEAEQPTAVPTEKMQGTASAETPAEKAEEATSAETPAEKAEEAASAEIPAEKAEEVASAEIPAEKTEIAKPTESPTKEPEEVKPTAEKNETAENAENVKKDSGEIITIVVKSGSGSYSICKQLEEAGLIKSASEYDTYLYEKGYDKRLVAATHEIPAGADEEQIALILTGK